ncbi:MAG TPA: hypothetical protein VMW19_02140 [Myxococcota bacterium]|nr:hypothetical protein [Myxococcota bacterium]
MRRIILLLLAASTCLVMSWACANDGAPKELLPDQTAAEASAPLAGEALVARKRDLERAYRDLVHFQETMRTLRFRRDRTGRTQFSYFLDAYLNDHLKPLLAGEWQSRHPELSALDANVRFAKAELLIRLEKHGDAADEMDEIEKRFHGREDMLVAYPTGQQTPLGKALQELRDRKWRG